MSAHGPKPPAAAPPAPIPDPIPVPRRIAVAGTSGTGKTTLARRIGSALDLPVTEIDALFHGPGWQQRPTFEQDVRAVLARPAWVIEWQHATARPEIARRADLLVWLDLPVRVTMWRVTRRTVVRRVRREELWNGNREAPLHTVLTDPEHIIRWAWRTRRLAAEMVPAASAANPGLRVVRLRSQHEVDRWLADLVAGRP